MSRVKKILIVSCVLAVGLGLAWPFRKSTSDTLYLPATGSLPGLSATGQIRNAPPPALPSSKQTREKRVIAQPASTTDTAKGFDLADHPALADPSDDLPPAPSLEEQGPVTPEFPPSQNSSRPAYATVSQPNQSTPAWPEEVIHEVSNGDTLEKLAERYLGDASRALELFDLNREQLSNPHLLPIGAELRIPVEPEPDID